MPEETRSITTPEGEMGAIVRRPDGEGPFPVVVSFHHGPGLDDGSKEAMQLIADAGYYVISHDRYHRVEPFLQADIAALRAEGPDSEGFKKFWGILLGTTEDMVAADVNALLEHIDGDPLARSAPMGCIGYCIGARSVIRAMSDHPDTFAAGVALHPSFCATDAPDSPHLLVPDLKGSLYVGIGSEDEMQSVAVNKALIDAVGELGERGTVEILDGADHGFAVPGHSYHEPSATRVYDEALTLYGKVVG